MHTPPAIASPSPRAHADEAGEGVISTAIAVLIMAFIGAGMWVGFNAVFSDACDNIATEVSVIGSGTGTGTADAGTQSDDTCAS